MIGKQIQKPVTNWTDYTQAALWCNANKAIIEDKGDCYEVIALPERTLEETKAAKLTELATAFDRATQTANCLSSFGFEINADETANRNISSLIIAMEATGQETVQFCAFDNTFHAVTLEQLKTMQLEIIANAQAIYQQKWVLRERINGSKTIEELEAIDITFEAETEEADGQTM